MVMEADQWMAADALDVAAWRSQTELDATLEEQRLRAAGLFAGASDPHRCCEDCGEPIGAQRLAAVPGARRCVTCQQHAESHGRLFAGAGMAA